MKELFTWWYINPDARIMYFFLVLYILLGSFTTYLRFFNNELENKLFLRHLPIVLGENKSYTSLYVATLTIIPYTCFTILYIILPVIIVFIPVAVIMLTLAKLADLSVKAATKQKGRSFEEINQAYEALLKEIEELKSNGTNRA